MKVTVLGSAAAECIPALFCNCPTCRKAAEKGGKDIRTRAQVLVNEDLMIDWPADAYLHKLQSGADFSKIETLLVTHSHSDHFRPLDLCLRGSVFAHGMSCEKLRIYCSEGLHVSAGFSRSGVYRRTGFKNGAWHDVAWFEKAIAPHTPPRRFKSMRSIDGEAVAAILRRFSD